ncbi:MAG: hypothetical protein COT84_08590 [Chlamydiae bacterium CG10_big_fil_rev_8_21_14_0_10_35_9]|nr:MAG: hypothetical protein COT84_08590 [Chlamydiae bacterium CG10_big_fil_rev_8_21_14_0_10_35_9]
MMKFLLKQKFSSLDKCLLSRYGKKLIVKYGFNPLHVAVFLNEFSWFEEVVNLDVQKTQKNYLGLNAKELAIYLNRKNFLSPLGHVTNKTISVEKENVRSNVSIEEFEQMMGITYLPNLEVSSFSHLRKLMKLTKRAQKNEQITSQEKWLGAYFSPEIYYDMNPAVTVKWIDPLKGWGLFATQDLRKKQWIGEYTGVLRPSNLKKDQKNAYCFEYAFSNFTIDAKDKGNLTRFINHSYTPNLTPYLCFQGQMLHIVFLTNAFIPKGTELSYDYGPDYWRKREKPI